MKNAVPPNRRPGRFPFIPPPGASAPFALLLRPLILVIVLLFAVLFFSTAGAQERGGAIWRGAQGLARGQAVSGDYFAFGDMVAISGTVEGDLYAAAGQVVVDGRVNGDVLVAAGRISISGTVDQDVRVAGGHVTITGTIGRNLTVAAGNAELAPSAVIRGGIVGAAGNFDLAAPVGGDARIAAGNLAISSRIAGRVQAGAGRLRIASSAEIGGDVDYWSNREASIEEEARIQGQITRRAPPERPEVWPRILALWALMVAGSFLSTLILGLLSARFLPGFHDSAVAALRERPLASLGIGFIAALAVPLICALLFAAVLTIPLALILAAAFLVLLYWSRIFAISRIGHAILGRFRPDAGRASAFIVGLLVYYVLAIIPFVGWLVVLLTILFGLGAELTARKNFYGIARSRQMI